MSITERKVIASRLMKKTLLTNLLETKHACMACIEYCFHVWAGAPSCYLEFLDKLQNWICVTVGPSAHD